MPFNLRISAPNVNPIECGFEASDFASFTKAVVGAVADNYTFQERAVRYKIDLAKNHFVITYKGIVVNRANIDWILSTDPKDLRVDLIPNERMAISAGGGSTDFGEVPRDGIVEPDAFTASAVDHGILDGSYWATSGTLPTIAASMLFEKFNGKDPILYHRDGAEFAAALYEDSDEGGRKKFVGYGVAKNIDFIKSNPDFLPAEIYESINIRGCHWALVKVKLSKGRSGNIESSMEYFDSLRWGAAEDVNRIAAIVKEGLGLSSLPRITQPPAPTTQADGASCGFVASFNFGSLIGCNSCAGYKARMEGNNKHPEGAQELRAFLIKHCQDYNPNPQLHPKSAACRMFRDHTSHNRGGIRSVAVVRDKVIFCQEIFKDFFSREAELLDLNRWLKDIVVETTQGVRKFAESARVAKISGKNDIWNIFTAFIDGDRESPEEFLDPRVGSLVRFVSNKLNTLKEKNRAEFAALHTPEKIGLLKMHITNFIKEFVDFELYKIRLCQKIMYEHYLFEERVGGRDEFRIALKSPLTEANHVLDNLGNGIYVIKPEILIVIQSLYEIKAGNPDAAQRRDVALLLDLKRGGASCRQDGGGKNKYLLKADEWSVGVIVDFDNVAKVIRSARYSGGDRDGEDFPLNRWDFKQVFEKFLSENALVKRNAEDEIAQKKAELEAIFSDFVAKGKFGEGEVAVIDFKGKQIRFNYIINFYQQINFGDHEDRIYFVNNSTIETYDTKNHGKLVNLIKYIGGDFEEFKTAIARIKAERERSVPPVAPPVPVVAAAPRIERALPMEAAAASVIAAPAPDSISDTYQLSKADIDILLNSHRVKKDNVKVLSTVELAANVINQSQVFSDFLGTYPNHQDLIIAKVINKFDIAASDSNIMSYIRSFIGSEPAFLGKGTSDEACLQIFCQLLFLYSQRVSDPVVIDKIDVEALKYELIEHATQLSGSSRAVGFDSKIEVFGDCLANPAGNSHLQDRADRRQDDLVWNLSSLIYGGVDKLSISVPVVNDFAGLNHYSLLDFDITYSRAENKFILRSGSFNPLFENSLSDEKLKIIFAEKLEGAIRKYSTEGMALEGAGFKYEIGKAESIPSFSYDQRQYGGDVVVGFIKAKIDGSEHILPENKEKCRALRAGIIRDAESLSRAELATSLKSYVGLDLNGEPDDLVCLQVYLQNCRNDERNQSVIDDIQGILTRSISREEIIIRKKTLFSEIRLATPEVGFGSGSSEAGRSKPIHVAEEGSESVATGVDLAELPLFNLEEIKESFTKFKPIISYRLSHNTALQQEIVIAGVTHKIKVVRKQSGLGDEDSEIYVAEGSGWVKSIMGISTIDLIAINQQREQEALSRFKELFKDRSQVELKFLAFAIFEFFVKNNYYKGALEIINLYQEKFGLEGNDFREFSYLLPQYYHQFPAISKDHQSQILADRNSLKDTLEEKLKEQQKEPQLGWQLLKFSLGSSFTPRRYQAILNMIFHDETLARFRKDVREIRKYVDNPEAFKHVEYDIFSESGHGDSKEDLTRREKSLSELKQFNQDVKELLGDKGDSGWKYLYYSLKEAVKVEDFERIIGKFNIIKDTPIYRNIANALGKIYSGVEAEVNDGYKILKKHLIVERLKRKGVPESFAVTLVDNFIEGRVNLEGVVADSTLVGLIADPKKIRAIFTKFVAFGVIENIDHLKARIDGKIKAQFQKKIAEEIQLLEGIKTVEMQGDEILFRGMDSASELAKEDIIRQFSESHISVSKVSNVTQQLGSYQIMRRRRDVYAGQDNKRAGYAVATTFAPAVAVRYAVGGDKYESPPGWVYDIRPKPGKKGVNMEKLSPYSEIDFEKIDPEDIFAVYQMKRESDGKVRVIDSIINPNYKKRGNEKEAETFRVGDRFVAANYWSTDIINALGEKSDFGYERSLKIRNFNIAQRTRFNARYGSDKVTHIEGYSKESLEQRRAEIAKDKAKEIARRKARKENKKLFDSYLKSHKNSADYFFRNTGSGADSDFKIFISVEADDLEKAAEILIKKGYFTCNDGLSKESKEFFQGSGSKIAIKRDGGRLAIILYASGDRSKESTKAWSERLNAIERDFYIAGIKPRPLTGEADGAGGVGVVDKKIPGAIYSYFKKDPEYCNSERRVDEDWSANSSKRDYYDPDDMVASADNYFLGVKVDLEGAMSAFTTERANVYFDEVTKLRDEMMATYKRMAKVNPWETKAEIQDSKPMRREIRVANCIRDVLLGKKTLEDLAALREAEAKEARVARIFDGATATAAVLPLGGAEDRIKKEAEERARAAEEAAKRLAVEVAAKERADAEVRAKAALEARRIAEEKAAAEKVRLESLRKAEGARKAAEEAAVEKARREAAAREAATLAVKKIKVAEKLPSGLTPSPSPSPGSVDVTKLSLYKLQASESEGSLWKDKERSNDFRAIKDQFTDEQILQVLKLAIIRVAKNLSVSKKDSLEIIDYARKHGGISNKYNEATGKYKRNDEELPPLWRQFSKCYQDECSKRKIITGRKNPGNLVGNRLSFVPTSVVEELKGANFQAEETTSDRLLMNKGVAIGVAAGFVVGAR